MTEQLPSFVHTFSGLYIDPLNLQPEDVLIADIAHHLSNQCRFQGGPKWHYSVAQHAWLVSYDPEVVAAGREWDALHHDDAEWVLQDMAKPLKVDPYLGRSYRGLEKRIERVLAPILGVKFPTDDCEVKRADIRCLVTEARDIMHGTDSWGYYQDIVPYTETIKKWSPEKAERKWLARYNELLALKEAE